MTLLAARAGGQSFLLAFAREDLAQALFVLREIWALGLTFSLEGQSVVSVTLALEFYKIVNFDVFPKTLCQ